MSDRVSTSKETVAAVANIPNNGSLEDIVDPELEKRFVRKIDLNVLPLIMIMQLVSFLDRTKIGNAKINCLTTDLHLKGAEFNGKGHRSEERSINYMRF
jgi:hypothetical protein